MADIYRVVYGGYLLDTVLPLSCSSRLINIIQRVQYGCCAGDCAGSTSNSLVSSTVNPVPPPFPSFQGWVLGVPWLCLLVCVAVPFLPLAVGSFIRPMDMVRCLCRPCPPFLPPITGGWAPESAVWRCLWHSPPIHPGPNQWVALIRPDWSRRHQIAGPQG